MSAFLKKCSEACGESCPSYCSGCSDHATCVSVRGQNSEGACCPTKVLLLGRGGPERTPMNVCLKKCSEVCYEK